MAVKNDTVAKITKPTTREKAKRQQCLSLVQARFELGFGFCWKSAS
jgi:hypothetical protein